MWGGMGSYAIWLKHDGFQALVMRHRTNRCHYFHLMFFDYCYARVSAGFVQDQYQKFCLSSPTLSACMRVGGNRGLCCSTFTKSQQNHNQNCFACEFSWHMICSFWEWKSEVCVHNSGQVSHEMCGVRSLHLKQNDLDFAQIQLSHAPCSPVCSSSQT